MELHITPIPFTEDELLSELGWFIANKMSSELLNKGLISEVHYQKIVDLNKKTFPIISVDLLPKKLDITDLQR